MKSYVGTIGVNLAVIADKNTNTITTIDNLRVGYNKSKIAPKSNLFSGVEVLLDAEEKV